MTTTQHRKLPHIDGPNQIQFVTFRLADSLPKAVLHDYRLLGSGGSADAHAVEKALDAGAGSCLLACPEHADLVQSALLHFHESRFQLHAWVVMPNHVHLLVEPGSGWPLRKLIQSWKRHTSLEINRRRGESGAVWQKDYFDRYIRDTSHFNRAVNYIHENPVSARLVDDAERWPWSSAKLWVGNWME